MKKIIIPSLLVLVAGAFIFVPSKKEQPLASSTEATWLTPYQPEVTQPQEEQITVEDTPVTTPTPKVNTNNNTAVAAEPQPIATQTNPDPVPQEPAKITVSAVQVIQLPDSEDKDCQLTYTDSSVVVKPWFRVTYNQGVRQTATYGPCNDSLIGQEKLSS